MENTEFSYELMTNGWSLNQVASHPLIIAALKSYSDNNNRRPVKVLGAVYSFITLNGGAKTLYTIRFEMENVNAKTKVKVTPKWLKENPFKWGFDGNHDESKEPRYC